MIVQTVLCLPFYVGPKVKKLFLPIDIQWQLFNELVAPVLLYGCEVWGMKIAQNSNSCNYVFVNTF